jgi:hypothetical protein
VATEREIALLCGGKEGKDGQGKKVVFLYLLKRGQQELCRPLVRLQRLASSVRRMASVPLFLAAEQKQSAMGIPRRSLSMSLVLRTK